MKACIKCRAELPDTARHCVYCGVVQQQGGPESALRSTLMGNPGMVAELTADSPVATPPGAYQEQMPQTKLSISNAEKAALGAITAGSYPGGAPPVVPSQPYGAPSQPHSGGAPQGAPPQQYGGPPQGGPLQQYGGPPQGGPPQGGPPQGGPPQQYGGPPQGVPSQPYGGAPFGGANLGIQNAQLGAAAHQPQYGGGHYQDAMTEQVRPLLAPGYSGDLRSWDESLTTQMLVFGVLLVACFVAPWAVGGGKTSFSWTIFSAEGAPFIAKMIPILLATTGVVSVALGALKLGSAARALAAAAIGLSPPLAFQLATSKPIEWQPIVAVVASILLVTGLIVRSRHTDLITGRILATVGVIAILALYLIPQNDVMPIKVLLDQIADIPGKHKVLPIVEMSAGGIAMGLIPLLLTLSCLLVWLPSPSRAGSSVLAWALIFWPFVATLAMLVLSENIGAALKVNLSRFIYLPLADAAWLALGSFGIAGVISERTRY